jgi:hypothetical protein
LRNDRDFEVEDDDEQAFSTYEIAK